MSEEDEHPNYHEEFMKQVIEDEANNPQQTYSVISALLPSHQISTTPIQEKITGQTLRTLRKQRLLKLSDSDRPDSKRSSTDTLDSWGENATDDEVFMWKLLMIQSMPLPMTVKRKHK